MDRIWLNSYPPGVPAEIDVTEFSSLVDLFDKGVGRFAERTAYINMGKSLSYRELEVLSAQFAGYLQGELKLAPGARVARPLTGKRDRAGRSQRGSANRAGSRRPPSLTD